MLFLLQAAAQHLPPGLPPINVTIQQPAGGMPEWARILISAGVGAVFGILGSLAVEYVKPSVTKTRLKHVIARQVGAELINNMATVESAYRVLRSDGLLVVSGETQLDFVQRILKVLRSDRYDLYFGSEKAIVYELDEDQLLPTFYDAIKRLKLDKDLQGHWHMAELGQLLRFTIGIGHRYISKHKLKYQATASSLEIEFSQAISAASVAGSGPSLAV